MTGSRDNHKNKRYDSLPNRAELKIIQVQQYYHPPLQVSKLPAFCHFTHKPILTQPKLIIKSLKTTQASQQCETTTSICKFFWSPHMFQIQLYIITYTNQNNFRLKNNPSLTLMPEESRVFSLCLEC